jgi:hypothetical protein
LKTMATGDWPNIASSSRVESSRYVNNQCGEVYGTVPDQA